jgi:hypothetical protein
VTDSFAGTEYPGYGQNQSEINVPIHKGEIMGRKGVSKRKPKTKSKTNSGGSASARPGEGATVQALLNKKEAPQLRGGTVPAATNKKKKKAK